ncbi:M23 family metallopeptidase [Pedobacter paludis]|uniref:M23 family metallopeptidase n=1 Tax=Pedobacter paludis TaxID=2203212 RepID=UPI00131501F2|nr:M23 family metallopeptidase [Pedobacter paludis]
MADKTWALQLLVFCVLSLGCQAQQDFSLPLNSLHLTSTFGGRIHPITRKPDFHRGIDLSARCEPVLSVLNGRVSATGFDPILGNFVKIDHQGIQVLYAHLRMAWVSRGKVVEAGTPIGITGSTGRSTGEHLHFAVSISGVYLDPLQFLMGLGEQRLRDCQTSLP